MFVAYLDAATDRLTSEFVRQVEVARMGSWFGRDPKAYKKWAAANPSKERKGLTGASLERAIMGLAVSHPGLVAIRA